ncbi:hypothetical protein EZ428_18915 [Pedobacter frigiditerrae]|uniref:Rhamnose/proton symporter RhaT n=1 Tax=Pedobacter frigiditerrae TaxID=2530452 RepID=A0A4R0MPD4_9SPHI|nr:L-rhamnose/proton symporter RhaT [Pedobacter frigiditerrae]TCC88709.1 hypothetical protein EZ428_18915 [Pedobacter frigiditerrae]
MNITVGLLILFIAGFFQGSFILPMTMTRKWNWENSWFTFSLLGMVLLNLVLAFAFIPNLLAVYRSVSANTLLLLLIFGLSWGLGAVLFGIAMNKLGMALGYPVIMGLIASFGAVIPMLIFHTDEVITPKGVTIMVGALIVVYGIVLCAKAHYLKGNTSNGGVHQKKNQDILIAVAAGILSCLPNIGYSFGQPLIDEALKAGASNFMAGNAVWALFFTMGFIPNAAYTIYLINKNQSFSLFNQSLARNSLAGLAMAFMWIGSFYLYGISTIKLGTWGAIIGWPLFISLSIITGNLWGLAKAEWKGASVNAQVKLKQGMMVIFFAIIIISFCNLL